MQVDSVVAELCFALALQKLDNGTQQNSANRIAKNPTFSDSV
jgi:hypothetical protein